MHINYNDSMPRREDPNFDKFYKVRPLISHPKTSFLQAYNPSRSLALDKIMIAFKGITSLKQYMPLKPIERGIQVRALACSEIGYLLNFPVYDGKKATDEEGSSGKRTLGIDSVLCGKILFFDL